MTATAYDPALEPLRRARRRRSAAAVQPAAPGPDLQAIMVALQAATADILANAENVREAYSRIAQLDDRLAAVERSMPADESEGLPRFVERQKAVHAASMPDPAAPVPTIAVERVEALEQAIAEVRKALADLAVRPAPVPVPPQREAGGLVSDMAIVSSVGGQSTIQPMERIEKAVRERLSAIAAPPLRVVEAAHLARNGQTAPLAMMERLGVAMGCTWEEAARSVISQHDAAAMIAAEVYAIQCDAKRRVAEGEDERGLAADVVAAIAIVGELKHAAVDP